jgi:hypothetical protein
MEKYDIYVASSLKNKRQPEVVQVLRSNGYKTYDFNNPGDGYRNFWWKEIDIEFEKWDVSKFCSAMRHPLSEQAYQVDKFVMRNAWAFIMVLPCGKSAHLELGWAIGARKLGIILAEKGKCEAEQMYHLAHLVTDNIDECLTWLNKFSEYRKRFAEQMRTINRLENMIYDAGRL